MIGGSFVRFGLLVSAMLCCLVAVAANDERVSDEEAERERERAAREQQQAMIAEMSCRDEDDLPESWLDRSHSFLSQRLCEPAAWFDGFFGDPRSFEETPVGTFIRVRNAVQWDQADGWGAGVRVRANISLPRVSERVRLLVTRDDDLSGDFRDGPSADDSDDRTRLGLRFIASEQARSQLDFDGTVRVTSGGLNPRLRARYRYVQGFSDNTLGRATQSVFWERADGFGTTSRLDWEWLPDRDRLVRWTGEGTISEASDGIDWRSSVTAFQQLSPSRAVRTEVGAFGFTDPRFEVEEYFVAFRFRQQFLRNWLFYEVQPERAWPLDLETGQRRSDWRLTLTLEVQFENQRSRDLRLREYLGDEDAAIEQWDDDEPIPVEAPGDRALDPVLLDIDELLEEEEQQEEEESSEDRP
ncbi:MAG: hypothetical protein ACXIUB_10300 [Wenzhouxiangella sp.]